MEEERNILCCVDLGFLAAIIFLSLRYSISVHKRLKKADMGKVNKIPLEYARFPLASVFGYSKPIGLQPSHPMLTTNTH